MRGKLTIAAGFFLLLAVFAFAPNVNAYVRDLGSSGGSPWSLNFTGNNGFNDLQYRSGPIGITTSPEVAPIYPVESEVTHDYMIGFKGPGICDVAIISAANTDEALSYAKEECPDCMVEDLTSDTTAMNEPQPNVSGEATFPLITERDAYCHIVR
ncbi:MAG: hypothetical protein WA666_10315 [Nitrospirota bacterium]